MRTDAAPPAPAYTPHRRAASSPPPPAPLQSSSSIVQLSRSRPCPRSGQAQRAPSPHRRIQSRLHVSSRPSLPCLCLERRHDHHIPLQPLRPMDRHQVDCTRVDRTARQKLFSRSFNLEVDCARRSSNSSSNCRYCRAFFISSRRRRHRRPATARSVRPTATASCVHVAPPLFASPSKLARSRAQPSSLSTSPRSTITSAMLRSAQMGSSSPASRCRSASLSPHHGARKTASHATRSAGCRSARVSANRSRISCRSLSGSISTARKGIELPPSASSTPRRSPADARGSAPAPRSSKALAPGLSGKRFSGSCHCLHSATIRRISSAACFVVPASPVLRLIVPNQELCAARPPPARRSRPPVPHSLNIRNLLGAGPGPPGLETPVKNHG